MMMKTTRQSSVARHRQGGAVLVLYAIGMLVMLAIGGMALDGAHAMLNKNRLQNTVDAAALAAAKRLDQNGNVAEADTIARAMFNNNADDAGNQDLANSLGDINLTVEFSNSANPFQPGTLPAEYVRVRATNFTMPSWLIAVLGIQEKHVAASAVSGPSPTIGSSCNLVPLIVCGDPLSPPDENDPNADFWGYDDEQVHVLKGGSKSGSQSGPIGPGNFQLARPGDDSGGADLRENVAGGYDDCVNMDENIPTEPGNVVGPMAQGINTRLNKFAGPINPGDYPPDVIVQQQNSELEYDADTNTITLDNGATIIVDATDLDYNYNDYTTDLGALNYDLQPMPGGPAQFDRRNLPIIVGDCTGTNNGQTDIPILGFGCFFMLQEVKQKGNEAELYGEFVEDCNAEGYSGPTPTIVPGPHRIQLYKDTGSFDS